MYIIMCECVCVYTCTYLRVCTVLYDVSVCNSEYV